MLNLNWFCHQGDMAFNHERKTKNPVSQEQEKIARLIEPTKAVVRAAISLLGPERNGYQSATRLAPDGTRLKVARLIDIDDDIYVSGYYDPHETGLLVRMRKDNKEETLHLPRRETSVNLRTVKEFLEVSPETLTSLAEKLKSSKAA